MKFGVSTWLWVSPFNDRSIYLLEKVKLMGYDIIEIPIEDPKDIDTVKINRIKKELGIDITVCGAFGPGRDLVNDDPMVVKNSMEYIDQCLIIASELGCKFFAGPMYSEVGKARMLAPDQRILEWEKAISNLRKVCDMADEKGLDIAIEPLNRFESDLLNNAEDARRMINDISHHRAKICLDGFHMAIEEKNFIEALDIAGDDLIHVQVSENYRGIPGTGTTNWSDFKLGLEKINYQGDLIIESFTPDNKSLAEAVSIWKPFADTQDQFAIEGLNFLKNLFSS